MSKYSLEEIHKSNVREAMSADDQARFDQLTKDDQLKLEKIFSMMRAEKDAIEKDARKAKGMMEDFDSVVDDIMDQGKSREDAEKIAGAINAKYVGNYREGVEENGTVNDYTEEIAEENDEDKLPMDEARVDRDVAERIEGMISIPLKRKFLDSFMDLWQDLIEEDPFYAEDVINHLNNEMHKEIDGYQAMGDKLAGMEENHAMQGVEAELESGEIGNMDALAEEDSVEEGYIETKGKALYPILKAGANATGDEVEMYVKSLAKDIELNGKEQYKDFTSEDFVEDFKEYIADKSLQEHFGRFLKDYQ